MKLHLTATMVLLVIWDHTVLPSTRHKWTLKTPARGRYSIYLPRPEWWKAELTYVHHIIKLDGFILSFYSIILCFIPFDRLSRLLCNQFFGAH